MVAQFRNLVFEGGGVKGIAYVGAMQILKQRDHLESIQRVGGTSAGAINALIFALGYSLLEQHEILRSTNFSKFMDDSFGVIKDFLRLKDKFGWHKGDYYSNWISKLIEQKLGSKDATFSDLKKSKNPDLYVTGTNLSTGFTEIFSYERHKDMPLRHALRITMSIPFFFQAIRHGPNDDVFVDGGVLLNYPVKLFDRIKYIDMINESEAARYTEYYNKESAKFELNNPGRSPYVYNKQTLGLRLDSQEEIGMFRYDEIPKRKKIESFSDYVLALMKAYMEFQGNQHLHSDDWERTIYINTLDVKTTDFKLNSNVKEALVMEGIRGAERYFQWHESPEQSPSNKVNEIASNTAKISVERQV